MSGLSLIKVGGAELQPGPTLDRLADTLASALRHQPMVIVHGGGPEIAALQARLGLEAQFVQGLRVTDTASMQVAEMVLSGLVNKRLTAQLVHRGVRAIGLSGTDGGLLRATKLRHSAGDLGRVGEVEKVNTTVVHDLMQAGFVPVISPISLGQDGQPFNVNADHAALAIAAALQIDEIIFLTNVPGVLRDGQIIEQLDIAAAESLIHAQIISGGMIPKVRSALKALQKGVGTARITNLAGLASGEGTRIIQSPSQS